MKFFEVSPDPHLRVVISRAKNFNVSDARTSFVAANPGSSYCIVQILKDYLDVYRPNSDDFLFPVLGQSGELVQNMVQYSTMLVALRGVLQEMNVPNFKQFSLHSPRTGGLSEAANSGLCSEAELVRHGRWNSGSSMPSRYRQQDIASQLRASRSLRVNSMRSA